VSKLLTNLVIHGIVSHLWRVPVTRLSIKTEHIKVANSPQAIKRARQNDVRRHHNQALRSDMRTTIKKVLSLISANDKDGAYAAYKSMCSKVDRLGRKNTISENRASRLKSRINARLKKTFA